MSLVDTLCVLHLLSEHQAQLEEQAAHKCVLHLVLLPCFILTV